MLSSSYVSVDNAIKENPILRITVNRFSSFWLVFSREKQILRNKLGIASKLSFRFFPFLFFFGRISVSLSFFILIRVILFRFANVDRLKPIGLKIATFKQIKNLLPILYGSCFLFVQFV